MTGHSMITQGFCTKYVANDEEVGTIIQAAINDAIGRCDTYFGIGKWRPIQIDQAVMLKTDDRLNYCYASVLIIAEEISNA